MQTVPYPQAHVLGYQQGFVGYLLVVHVGGNVDKSGQLFVDGVVGSPHPVVVVVGAVHLYQRRMVGRDGIQVAISVAGILLLVLVKGFPCALHGA